MRIDRQEVRRARRDRHPRAPAVHALQQARKIATGRVENLGVDRIERKYLEVEGRTGRKPVLATVNALVKRSVGVARGEVEDLRRRRVNGEPIDPAAGLLDFSGSPGRPSVRALQNPVWGQLRPERNHAGLPDNERRRTGRDDRENAVVPGVSGSGTRLQCFPPSELL